MIETDLVRRLIATQFPQWASLPIRPVDRGGWDNRTFHLGDEMSVRLPSAERYVEAVAKEQEWLPILAPQLPLPIPVPLGKGEPGEGYPFPWSVNSWIEGRAATADGIADLTEFAVDLADFLAALKRIDATGGPQAGAHNFYRGGPLAVYDGETQAAVKDLGDRIPGELVLRIWREALESTWDGPPEWFHGDMSTGNLLINDDGRLSAVIDFGTCGVGDPACDVAIAWTLFKAESRDAFRERLAIDDGTWARGRGWALWKALVTYDGYYASPRVVEETLSSL
ncbi:MAG TPA: aminoglycoside phosphotransferase family protein [Candidatus Limnocylindrales bacterium]